MNLLLTSCVPEPEAPRIELKENNQLAKVRAWFEENKTKLRLPERGSNFRSESQELILPFFEKEPDWEKFHHYYFPDGREVFEISLENATKYFPTSMLDSFPNRNPAEVVIQNILFVKHPTQERFDPVIVRYYPDNSSNEKSFEDMNYRSIDYDWSGRIEMFTYDERHFVGFEIREGEVVSNYTLKSHEGEKRKSTANMDVRCHTTFHAVGYQVCVGGTCHTTIERYIAQTSCSGSSGSDSIDYFSIPRKEDDTKAPATDGTGGNCSSCEDPTTIPAPSQNLRIQIDKSFSDNAYLMCILGKLRLSKFANTLALFDGTVPNGRNVILKVGEVPKRPGNMEAANAETSDEMGPYHIQITINKGRLNLGSLELARIILHEMIHAELFVANYHKGGSPIDGNFEANFNLYMEKYRLEGNSVIQHNYMAENMVNKIGSVLSSIHTNLGKQQFLDHPETKKVFRNGFDSNFYKGLAWKGLHSTDKWNYNLPERTDFVNFQKLADVALSNDCNTN